MTKFNDFENSIKNIIKHDLGKLKEIHDAFVKKLHQGDGSRDYVEKIEFNKGVTIVRLAGKATYETMKYIEKQFIAQMKGKTVKNILFDYRKVSDIDTSGIAELVELWEQMKELHEGNVIGLVNIPPKLESLLELTSTQGLFRLFDSEETAIKHLST